MTHLSDYSFVQRSIANGWFILWFVTYVFQYDRFEALSIRRIKRFELRSIVTIIILIAIPTHLLYDIGITTIKYQEGFWVNPSTNEIMGSPSSLWTQTNQNISSALDYCLALAMALLISCFFLLQSFYHYISKSVTKTSYMSSFEFRLNIVCSCVVVVVFPMIQFLYRNDHAHKEAAPEMAFSVVTLSIALLGVRSHFRFKRLLKVALMSLTENTQNVAEKLEYFKDMNLILTASAFISAFSLGTLCIDGLSPNPVIATNKFASDLLVCNVNFVEFIIWVTLVVIFYPRRSIVGNSFGHTSNGSLSRTGANASGRNVQGQQKQPSNNKSDESLVIPYKAPETPATNPNNVRQEYVDMQRVPRDSYQQHDNYNDTYPLTRASGVTSTDILQLDIYKSLYDPLQSNTGPSSAGQSPDFGRQQQFRLSQQTQQPQPSFPGMRAMSPTPSPLSPTARLNGAGSPLSFESLQHPRVASPVPAYGSAVSRPSATGPATTRVGQHTFVLEDTPGSAHQRAKMMMQQQQQGSGGSVFTDAQARPSIPTRSRKEPRNLPQN